MKFSLRIFQKSDLLWQRLLAYSFRLTGWKVFIARYRYRRDILLSEDEILIVAASLRRHPGSFLVFGAGNDSVFWATLNHGHPTVFLESNSNWMKRIGSNAKFLDIYHVIYTTRLDEMRAPETNGFAPPALDISETIRGQTWDTVFVDAPQGWGDGPGRLQSIFEASRLVAEGGRIFVHDCDREGEQYLTGHYLREFQCRKVNYRLWVFEK